MSISKLLLVMLNPNDLLHLPKNQVKVSPHYFRVQGCPDLRSLISQVPSISTVALIFEPVRTCWVVPNALKISKIYLGQ